MPQKSRPTATFPVYRSFLPQAASKSQGQAPLAPKSQTEPSTSQGEDALAPKSQTEPSTSQGEAALAPKSQTEPSTSQGEDALAPKSQTEPSTSQGEAALAPKSQTEPSTSQGQVAHRPNSKTQQATSHRAQSIVKLHLAAEQVLRALMEVLLIALIFHFNRKATGLRARGQALKTYFMQAVLSNLKGLEGSPAMFLSEVIQAVSVFQNENVKTTLPAVKSLFPWLKNCDQYAVLSSKLDVCSLIAEFNTTRASDTCNAVLVKESNSHLDSLYEKVVCGELTTKFVSDSSNRLCVVLHEYKMQAESTQDDKCEYNKLAEVIEWLKKKTCVWITNGIPQSVIKDLIAFMAKIMPTYCSQTIPEVEPMVVPQLAADEGNGTVLGNPETDRYTKINDVWLIEVFQLFNEGFSNDKPYTKYWNGNLLVQGNQVPCVFLWVPQTYTDLKYHNSIFIMDRGSLKLFGLVRTTRIEQKFSKTNMAVFQCNGNLPKTGAGTPKCQALIRVPLVQEQLGDQVLSVVIEAEHGIGCSTDSGQVVRSCYSQLCGVQLRMRPQTTTMSSGDKAELLNKIMGKIFEKNDSLLNAWLEMSANTTLSTAICIAERKEASSPQLLSLVIADTQAKMEALTEYMMENLQDHQDQITAVQEQSDKNTEKTEQQEAEMKKLKASVVGVDNKCDKNKEEQKEDKKEVQSKLKAIDKKVDETNQETQELKKTVTRLEEALNVMKEQPKE